MKETKEFINALFDTATQAVISFKDGAQITDVADFIDEGMRWPEAFLGLMENFKPEALSTTVEEIEALFESQRAKLVNDAGLDEFLAGTIVSSTKSIYYAIVTAIKMSDSHTDPV